MADDALPSLQEIASCIAGYDPKALPVAQAQEFIARLVTPVDAVESLALRSALGRVLARDVISGIDVPGLDNSAMDGYALRGSDLAADAQNLLQLAYRRVPVSGRHSGQRVRANRHVPDTFVRFPCLSALRPRT